MRVARSIFHVLRCDVYDPTAPLRPLYNNCLRRVTSLKLHSSLGLLMFAITVITGCVFYGVLMTPHKRNTVSLKWFCSPYILRPLHFERSCPRITSKLHFHFVTSLSVSCRFVTQSSGKFMKLV